MKRNYFLPFILIFIFPCFLNICPAGAVDELVLSGTPRSVDLKQGTAVVEVYSGSCPGSRKFRTDDAEYLSKLLDREISFRIDSNTCSDGQTRLMHDIVPQRREGRP